MNLWKAASHAGLSFPLLLVSFATGYLPFGAGFVLGYWLGREVAQHEAKRSGKWYRGFLFWNWTTQTWADLAFPYTLVLIFIVWSLL